MTWGKMLTEKNDLQKIKNYMNDNYIVSRDDYIIMLASNPNTKPSASTKGLRAQYFNNIDLSGGAQLIRNDNKIDFNWHGDAPAVGLGKDLFSVRWTGTIMPIYSEKYTFTASSDDGVRLWIDDKLVIDSWKKQSGVGREGSIELTAGTSYDIKVEYYENRGDANIRLLWKSASQKQGVIPKSALTLPK